ncbi:MAG: hypothetical protein HKN47_10485 [Pirellulaceae bacterium]|nr:hypothetical protein [Pirellulaceae bacterium]
MTDSIDESADFRSSSWLTHQWVAAGIVSSASRFIPIPFVDDIVRGQCHRFVVARTLAHHNREDLLANLKPYYSPAGGCLSGCLGTIARAPLKLLFFPIRKVIAIVTSVRGVPLEITRTVLLGRTLERSLREPNWDLTSEHAERMRHAFDTAFHRMDFRVARAAMSDALSSASGWKTAAIASAKRIVDRPDEIPSEMVVESAVDDSAKNIEAVLERPEFLALFDEFDRRFDEHFD